MPRRSRTQITAEYAKIIVRKLKGKLSNDVQAHKHYDVYSLDGSRWLTSLSLRHGSRDNAGHDHMIGELGVNAFKAKELARCNITPEKWEKEFEKRT